MVLMKKMLMSILCLSLCFSVIASRRMQKDLMLEIARGNISGMSFVNKFGRNADVDVASEEDVWDGGGTWVAPTTARIHDIVSTSTDDDGSPAGVGARTLRVFGLTGWGAAEVSEDITLDGTTNVPTVNSYVIIHRMEVLTKGATDVNVGVITATAQTDGTVTAQINTSEGQTQMAIYGLPSTQKAYMTDFYASFNKSGGAAGALDVTLLINLEPDAELTNFVVKNTQSVMTTGTSHLRHSFRPYFEIPGPAIIKIKGAVSANDIDVSAGFDLIIVDN